MQQVLSRHIINKDIIIHNNGNIVDYDDLCALIDHWKVLLVERYHARPGKKIVIEFINPSAVYYAAQFAAWELGMIVIGEWPAAYDQEDTVAHRMTMHGRIDYAVVEYDQTIPSHPNYNYWNHRRTTANADYVITDREFDEFETPCPERANIIKQTILATPDLDALWGASGGTTGVAKPTYNSHRKLYVSSLRHVKLLNFQPTDHCLHIQNTLYGAGVWYWFLPAMMSAKEHSIYVSKDSVEIARVIEDKKINKVQFHTLPLILNFIDAVLPLSHCLEISSLFVLPKESVETVQRKRINAVHMVFGDTTIGGTFFLKKITQDTLASHYEKNCMEELPDDFFEFELREGILWMQIPSLNQDWRTSGDRFEIRDRKYYFYGRGNQYTINGETLTLGDLDAEVDRLFGINATSVVDEKEQKIYLAVWKENAQAESELAQYFKFNFKKIQIDQIARGLDPNRFVASRKIDREKLRDYFRYYHLKPV
jgi:hypothetical protein